MFNPNYPDCQISQHTVSRIERKFTEAGQVRDLPISGTLNFQEYIKRSFVF